MNPTRLCPICNRPLPEGENARKFRPFCSRRCADLDLGRWLKGAYAIPAATNEDETDAEAAAEGTDDGEEGGPRVKH